MEKGSFLLYREYGEEISLMTDEEAGAFIKAVFAYECGGDVPELTGGARMLFSIFKRKLDDNRAKYEAVCERNRENGRRGGRPSSPKESGENPGSSPDFSENREEAPDSFVNPEKPTGFSGNPKNPNPNPNPEPEGQEIYDASDEASAPAGPGRTDYEAYRGVFLEECPSLAKPGPAAKWSDNRRKTLRARHVSPEEFRQVCRRVERSDFLTGRESGWHGCSFDWIIKAANWQKINEGNYDNRGSPGGGTGQGRTQASYDINQLEELAFFSLPENL